MTIEFHDVSKAVLAGRKRRPLFKHFEFWMEKGERVAVLGPKGSGKSTFLQLICGATPVDEGWVERTSTVSWPIPNSKFLNFATPVATNLRFLARLYGIKQDKFLNEVVELAEFQSFANTKLGDVPRSAMERLSFAIAMWFDFDIYLFDEKILPKIAGFRDRAAQILEARVKGKGLLVATSMPKEVLEHCETAFVIDGGRAEHYTNLAAALKHFEALSNVEPTGDEQEIEEEEDEDDTSIF